MNILKFLSFNYLHIKSQLYDPHKQNILRFSVMFNKEEFEGHCYMIH